MAARLLWLPADRRTEAVSGIGSQVEAEETAVVMFLPAPCGGGLRPGPARSIDVAGVSVESEARLELQAAARSGAPGLDA
ncbi:MAG: hypothetical protein ACRENY_04835 [Candidatus Dormibacteria bacterium]